MKESKNNVNIFNFPAKNYSSNVFSETVEYQKKYGFDIGTGEHAAWNNEADAFKHAYMQAQLSLWVGKHAAKFAGDFHEWQGNKTMGQSKGEENMDSWNNEQGREIAKEIIHEYGVLSTIPSQKVNDIIAEKIMQRMKDGQLITSPRDKREYKTKQFGKPTGYAAPSQSGNIFTPHEIGAMSPEEFSQNEAAIMQQMKYGLITNQGVNYFGYTNPVTGSGHIYSRENIGMMSTDEYTQNEKAINAQLNTIGIPTNVELESACQRGRGLIYVESYTRSDGTQVKGYYRSR